MKTITKQLSSSRIAVLSVVLAAILGVFAFSFASQQTAWAEDVADSQNQTYEITINKSDNGTVTADKVKDLKAGDKVKLTIEPAGGYELDKLTVKAVGNVTASADNPSPEGEGDPVDVDKDYTFEMPESDVTITASFKKIDDDNDGKEPSTPAVASYAVTATADPEAGGTATAKIDDPTEDGKALEGAKVTLTAKANEGYEFEKWTITGIDFEGDDSQKSIEITMGTEDVTAVASFKETQDPAPAADTYKVTINKSDNGTVTADKVEGLEAGDEVKLTIEPADGYELDKLTVKADKEDLAPIDTNGGVFKMPESNVTVTASFKEKAKENDNDEKATTDDKKAESKTFELVVSKTDAKTGAPLSGAEFELKNANGGVLYTWTTDGSAITYKLDQDTKYVLSETKAPAGYSREKDININCVDGKVMIDQGAKAVELKKNDDGYATLNVKDMSGSGVRSNTTSPKTGDNSTPAIIGGVVVIAAAAVAFAAYRKNKAGKESDNEE